MIGNSQESAAPSTGHKILREGKGREVGRHGKIRSQYLFPITFLDVECQKISNNQALFMYLNSASRARKRCWPSCVPFSPQNSKAQGSGGR